MTKKDSSLQFRYKIQSLLIFLLHTMEMQIPNSNFNPLRRLISSSNSNAQRLHRPTNIHRRETFPRPSQFDDNLMSFSLVPTWLRLLDNQRTAEESYPFNFSPTVLSTNTSKATSPLNGPLCFDFPSGMAVSSNDVDRQHWEEETLWLDAEAQNDDLEILYKSFRY